MKRIAVLALPIVALATSAAHAQSRAHNDARGYAEILGQSVWCAVSREDRQAYESMALEAIAAASYNDPETSAAQGMFKTLVGEAARAGADRDCTVVEASFRQSFDALSTMDRTPKRAPLPGTPDEQGT